LFDVADSPLLRAQSPEPEPDVRSYIDLTAALLEILLKKSLAPMVLF
jgi:hypothetical protein